MLACTLNEKYRENTRNIESTKENIKSEHKEKTELDAFKQLHCVLPT